MNDLLLAPKNKIDPFDNKNAQSFYNLAPTTIQEKMDAIPKEILELDEAQLESKLRSDLNELSRIRLALWYDYNIAVSMSRKINITNIYGSVCSLPVFNRKISNSYALAYILTPPLDYQVAMNELLHIGVGQWREILTLPNQNPDGSVNTKILDVKFKITQDVINRTKGQVVQRIESKNMNMNIGGNGEPTKRDVGDIDDEIQALERELNSPHQGKDDEG